MDNKFIVTTYHVLDRWRRGADFLIDNEDIFAPVDKIPIGYCLAFRNNVKRLYEHRLSFEDSWFRSGHDPDDFFRPLSIFGGDDAIRVLSDAYYKYLFSLDEKDRLIMLELDRRHKKSYERYKAEYHKPDWDEFVWI